MSGSRSLGRHALFAAVMAVEVALAWVRFLAATLLRERLAHD